MFPFTYFMERWQEMNLVMSEDNFKLGKILRQATLTERHQLPEKSRDELGVVNVIIIRRTTIIICIIMFIAFIFVTI